MCKISVVIATYNGVQFFEKQLISIINQTLLPDEIIISDDGSKDKTIEIAEKIKDKSKVKFKIYKNNVNVGYIKNFKQAISKATGDYIFLCDQDDIWEPEKVRDEIYFLQYLGKDLACTGFRLIDENSDIIENLDYLKSDPINGYTSWSNEVYDINIKRLVWGNFSPGCTYCFTRKIKDIYLQIDNLELSHDFQLFLISACLSSAIFIDRPLSQYRLHTNNTIGMNQKEPKRQRHFKPRILRYLGQLSKLIQIPYYRYSKIVLYLRIPKFRAILVHKFKCENKMKFL